MTVSYDDSEDALTFINSHNAPELSQVGLVLIKRLPLFVNWDPQNEAVGVLVERIKQGLFSYQVEYKAYFDKNKNKRDKISETAPRV
jgi:rhamnose utilization protein RhaD (predicted bifunctional aldolase and dehydrogenase)